MKIYILWPHDQTRDNWIINRWFRRKDGVPDYAPLAPYRDFVCLSCRRIDYDSVFNLGFAKAKTFRGKGDLLRSNDGFWCISQSLVDLFEREGVQGMKFSRISDTDWYVVNIVRRVRVSPDVYLAIGKPCPSCGRSTEILDCVRSMGQFLDDPPKHSVFTTIEYRERDDRDMLLNESVLKLFVEAQIRGCVANQIPLREGMPFDQVIL